MAWMMVNISEVSGPLLSEHILGIVAYSQRAGFVLVYAEPDP